MENTNIEHELVLLRDILIRELETINTYQHQLEQAQSAEVRNFLSHIIEEEKEHVAEAVELIRKFDPTQAALFGVSHHYSNPSESKSLEINKNVPESQVVSKISFTVGSLRGSGKA